MPRLGLCKKNTRKKSQATHFVLKIRSQRKTGGFLVDFDLDVDPRGPRLGAVHHGVEQMPNRREVRSLNVQLDPMHVLHHAHKGADPAHNILNRLALTTASETEAICTAISRHDDKQAVDGPLEEVLKDADVMHHCMNDLSKAVKDKEAARYAALRKEFGLK